METAKTLALIVLSISIAIAGQFCLKYGVMHSSGRVALSSVSDSVAQVLLILQTPIIWVGLALYAVGAVTWMLVLSRADLSYAYPMLALGYVIVTALAAVLGHEHVTFLRWTGVVLIVSGVLLIGNEAFFQRLLARVTSLVASL